MSPHLRLGRVDARTRAVALLLHGGAETGTEPVSRWAGPPLRMVPFGWVIRVRTRRITVARLRFRQRGWNGPSADPVADVRDALARIDARRPGVPVVLVGHSMGARAAIRAAGDPNVAGVVALAPWLPAGEGVDQLAGRMLVVIHGTEDRRTSPAASEAYAAAAEPVARHVEYVTIRGGDHAMLHQVREWHRLTADAVDRIAPPSPRRLGP